MQFWKPSWHFFGHPISARLPQKCTVFQSPIAFTAQVAYPSKALALDTTDKLSHGWGRALAVAYAIFWVFSFAMFSITLAWSSWMSPRCKWFS